MKTIKHLQLILIFFISFQFTSCDKSENTKVNPIVGIWIYESFEYVCPNPVDNNSGTISCTSTDCNTLTFKKDGTYQYTELEMGIEDIEGGTYSINGSIITFCEDGIDCDVTRTYEINGDVLTLTESFECEQIETYKKK